MKVTIYTQAYNAEKYISKCIESVLNQTFSDFEYILIDNGSNDNTRDIIKSFADKDNRVIPILYDKNIRGLLAKHKDDFNGEFYTVLDSDDWIEPNYLERLLKVAEETGADIVNTGSIMFDDNNSEKKKVFLENRLFIESSDYAKYFPNLHWYFRQNWGMLVKTDLIRNIIFPNLEEIGISYGGDTLFSLRLLKESKSICIDNSALHHYRLHPNSTSYKFDNRRSFSDYYLYNDAVAFLENYGTLSKRNTAFLLIIYFLATVDTLKVIVKADIEDKNKLNEIEKILQSDVTRNAFRFSLNQLEFIISEFGSEISEQCSDNRLIVISYYLRIYLNSKKHSISAHNMLKIYLPKCVDILSDDLIPLFLKEKTLMEALSNDDYIKLSEDLSKFIISNKYGTKTILSDLIKKLQVDNPIASKVTNDTFIKKYYNIFNDVIHLNYRNALEKMTVILTEKGNDITEDFIWLYLTVAAQQNRVDEFLYGKLISAGFYLKCNRYEESRTAINDLAEMGVEDNDEIIRIKKELDAVGK